MCICISFFAHNLDSRASFHVVFSNRLITGSLLRFIFHKIHFMEAYLSRVEAIPTSWWFAIPAVTAWDAVVRPYILLVPHWQKAFKEPKGLKNRKKGQKNH